MIRVATPNNFFACLLALASSMGMFHGILLRRVTGGQLPVVGTFINLNLCDWPFDLSALFEVTAERKEPGKVRSGQTHNEVCIQLVKEQGVLQAEDRDHK